MTTQNENARLDLAALRQREVQMMGAALSTRNWHGMETAYNQLRDKIDAELTRLRSLPVAAPAAVEEDRVLADLIKTRLLGVDPDDQDLQLEDDDWRRILAALSPTHAEGETR